MMHGWNYNVYIIQFFSIHTIRSNRIQCVYLISFFHKRSISFGTSSISINIKSSMLWPVLFVLGASIAKFTAIVSLSVHESGERICTPSENYRPSIGHRDPSHCKILENLSLGFPRRRGDPRPETWTITVCWEVSCCCACDYRISRFNNSHSINISGKVYIGKSIAITSETICLPVLSLSLLVIPILFL